MNNMEKIKKFLSGEALQIIIAVVIIATGVFLLAKPGTSLVTICYILGVTSLIKGVTALLKTKFQSDNKTVAASGVGFIVAGVVLFLHPKFLLSIIPVIIGVCILGYGIFSFVTNRKKGLMGKILSAVSVIIGITVIITPFKFAEAVTAIIGIALIAVGVLIILAEVNARKQIRIQIPDNDSNGYQEVDFTDVED